MHKQTSLESRICIMCGITYMPRQDRQLVCQKKTCKHNYKKKQNREYIKEHRKVVLVDHPERPCAECGEIFKPRRINTCTCGTECQKKRARHLANGTQIYIDTTKIRAYTSTSTMTIVSDLLRGKSLKDIANVLNRDIKDVKRHIAEIDGNGTRAKWERRIREYREI